MGRILGLILIVGGFVVAIIISVLMWTYNAEGNLSTGAAVLGFALGMFVLVLPQWGVGIYLLMQGTREAKVTATAEQQRTLLDIIQSRGQVDINDLAIEMQAGRDEVQKMVHQLVGLGLYSGYINWDQGTLYSAEASKLRELTECLNCGGKLELAGKGVIQCPYCGTEYFLD